MTKRKPWPMKRSGLFLLYTIVVLNLWRVVEGYAELGKVQMLKR